MMANGWSLLLQDIFGAFWLLSLEQIAAAVAPSHFSRALKLNSIW